MDRLRKLNTDAAQFARDIESEAKRITWPSRQETIKSTLAVVVISSIFASFLGLVDYVFSWMVRLILS
jgi:preprotein translocase subunit SecE